MRRSRSLVELSTNAGSMSTTHSRASPRSDFRQRESALPGVAEVWSLANAASLGALSEEANRQATMIGYIDAFYLFAVTATLALPCVLLVRWPGKQH